VIATKLVSIASLIAVYILPSGSHPIPHIAACLLHKTYVAIDDLSPVPYAILDALDLLLLLGFATTLVEHIPKATLSQQERYATNDLVMVE
jgi:hypothetical protein